MKAQDFIGSPIVLEQLHALKSDAKLKNKQYSDVVDAAGNQYVDLVMEGGGVWGIALAGYVHVLEEMGIRFLQIGGASAGAINTLLMASAGGYEEKKTAWILEKLAAKNLAEMIDGDSDAQDFVETLMEGGKLMKLAWKGIQVVDNFKEDLGLNPGDDFLNWLKGCIAEKGIHSVKDLNDLRSRLPEGLQTREGKNIRAEKISRIGLISAEVTTETKVEFPRMAELYWEDPEQVNPAEFARASMSVPFFFHPYTLTNIPQGENSMETWSKWERMTGFKGGAPKEVKFVDGGMVSNFPIDLFHNYHSDKPNAPTFGVKLEVDRLKPHETENIFKLFGAMFNTARNIHDYQFILKHPDFKQLVTYIDTGDHNWLNFKLTEEDQLDLFNRGAVAAANFLRSFDWETYKSKRVQLNKMMKPDADLITS